MHYHNHTPTPFPTLAYFGNPFISAGQVQISAPLHQHSRPTILKSNALQVPANLSPQGRPLHEAWGQFVQQSVRQSVHGRRNQYLEESVPFYSDGLSTSALPTVPRFWNDYLGLAKGLLEILRQLFPHMTPRP